MKNRLTLILVVIGFSLAAQQPALVWAKQNGDGDNELGLAIETDAAGNVYSAGTFENTVDFNPAPGIGGNQFLLSSDGGTDGYVQKLDNDGNFEWAFRLGGSSADVVNSLIVDAAGNVIVTGTFTGVVDMDPGTGTVLLGSSPTWVSDIFVASYTAQGQLNWAKSLGSSGSEQSTSLARGLNGQVIVAGAFEGTVDFDPGVGTTNKTSLGDQDGFIAVLNSVGNFVWAATFGGIDFDQVNAVVADASGNVFATGVFNDTADFDPGNGTYPVASAGRSDAFVLKLTSTGTLNWAGQIGGADKDGGNDLALDAAGDVYLIGKLIGTGDADPGAGVYTISDSALAGGGMVVKLTNAGSFGWAYMISNGGPVDGTSVAVGADGMIYLAMNFFGTVDADPSAATANFSQTGTNPASEVLFLQNDLAGNFTWGFSIGGTYDDFVNDIYVDAAGDILATGQYTISADFDPSANTFNLTSTWQNSDVFVVRYSQNLSGIIEANASWCSLAPNPMQGISTLDFGTEVQQLTVTVRDLSGRIVSRQQANNIRFWQVAIDDAAGVYCVTVEAEGHASTTLRVVKTAHN